MQAEKFWTVPREWPGETVFVIAGGTSVLSQPVDRLKGRRVIAVNSSYEAAPWADVVFSIDPEWIRLHRPKLEELRKRVVTTSRSHGMRSALRLGKMRPPGLSLDPSVVAARRTSLHGAINLAVHFGAGRIVLLGADGGPLKRGGPTHHHTPHPRKNDPHCWGLHAEDLVTLNPPLAKLGIEVLNASPGTNWPHLWPVVSLAEVLDAEATEA